MYDDNGSVVEGAWVGPLRPAPAHSAYSFHDGLDLCFAREFKSRRPDELKAVKPVSGDGVREVLD